MKGQPIPPREKELITQFVQYYHEYFALPNEKQSNFLDFGCALGLGVLTCPGLAIYIYMKSHNMNDSIEAIMDCDRPKE